MIQWKFLVCILLFGVLFQEVNSDMLCFNDKLETYPRPLLRLVAKFCKGLMELLEVVLNDIDECGVDINLDEFQEILEDLCNFEKKTYLELMNGVQCAPSLMFHLATCNNIHGTSLSSGGCSNVQPFMKCLRDRSTEHCKVGAGGKFLNRIVTAMGNLCEGLCKELTDLKISLFTKRMQRMMEEL